MINQRSKPIQKKPKPLPTANSISSPPDSEYPKHLREVTKHPLRQREALVQNYNHPNKHEGYSSNNGGGGGVRKGTWNEQGGLSSN